MEKEGLMRIQVVVICAVVGVLGLITVILGVAGQASTAKFVAITNYDLHTCEYQSTPAVGCGIVAALLALTAQIVVTVASVCYGCCRTWGIPTETKRIVAIVLAVSSWLLVIIAVVLFIVGAVANVGEDTPTSHDDYDDYDDDDVCYDRHGQGSGAFAAATVVYLVAVGFQITSYILLQATAASSAKPLEEQQSGIAHMQPEPQNADHRTAAGGDSPTPALTSLSESRAEPTSQV